VIDVAADKPAHTAVPFVSATVKDDDVLFRNTQKDPANNPAVLLGNVIPVIVGDVPDMV
jgi:hypothetical protein